MTVETAIILPVLFICIFWMMDGGIRLYTETVRLSKKQEMWQDFDPAKKFRNLELLGDVF